jgi:hypothetical protein
LGAGCLGRIDCRRDVLRLGNTHCR